MCNIRQGERLRWLIVITVIDVATLRAKVNVPVTNGLAPCGWLKARFGWVMLMANRC